MDDKDAWRAQQAAQDQDNSVQINNLRSELDAQRKSEDDLRQDLSDTKQKLSQAATNATAVLNQPLPLHTTPGMTPPTLQKGQRLPNPALPLITLSGGDQTQGGVPPVPTHELELIQFNNPNPAPDTSRNLGQGKDGGADQAKAAQFLPGTSFVKAVMLNGVDALTGGQAESDPLPIALHVLDTANLANKYRMDIKDCRFLAAAWGDLSSERTMARLVSMTCIINGETVEMPIKGYLVSENDGKAGVQGRLVTKQGQLIANAMLSGIAGGIGQAFSQSSSTTSTSPLGTTSTVQPNAVATAAIGGGMISTGNALQQYYLKAADKLFPVIETDAGTLVDVLITKGAEFTPKGNISDDTSRDMVRRNSLSSRSDNNDE